MLTVLDPPPIVGRFRPSEPMQMRCTQGHKVPLEDNPGLRCQECIAVGKKRRAIKEKREARKAKARFVAKQAREAGSGTRQSATDILAEFVDLYRGADSDTLNRAVGTYADKLARSRLLGRGNRGKIRYTAEELTAGARIDLKNAVEDSRLAKDESKKPWNYLRVKPEAEAAWDRFNKQLNKARDSGKGLPNCEDDPGPWMDYDDENPPSAEEAYSLCVDCPLLAACGLYAELDRPTHGIWAGDRFENGEVVND